MREILFKAKRIDNGEWVYGNYAFCDCFEKQKHYIFQNKPLEYAVDPETVSQYIGLCDKNGRKIFEGDIVKTKYELGRGGFYVFEVYFNENLCQFALTINRGSYTKNKQYDWLQLTELKSKKIEVIGNIFDNPELLEDK